MPSVVLIVHNVRSTHNVGSMLRTSEGLGVEKVYLTGYTPYPLAQHDERLPHLACKIDAQIHKTALDAERLVAWEHQADILPVIEVLRSRGYQILALEQDPRSVKFTDFSAPDKVALVVGREVEGIEQAVRDQADAVIEIPMRGIKESFNVAVAAAIALYELTSR